MNTIEIRLYEMLLRVREFGAAHADRFSPTTLGGKMFAALATIVDNLHTHIAMQASGRGAEREKFTERAAARGALQKTLLLIKRTARAIAQEIPGYDSKFRVPRKRNDERLIAAARGFAQDVEPMADRFIAHGHPATFVADLSAQIDAFARTIVDGSVARGTHVAAAAGIRKGLDEGVAVVQRLDAIVPLAIGDDVELLAMWNGARRVTRPSPPVEPSTPVPPAKAVA